MKECLSSSTHGAWRNLIALIFFPCRPILRQRSYPRPTSSCPSISFGILREPWEVSYPVVSTYFVESPVGEHITPQYSAQLIHKTGRFIIDVVCRLSAHILKHQRVHMLSKNNYLWFFGWFSVGENNPGAEAVHEITQMCAMNIVRQARHTWKQTACIHPNPETKQSRGKQGI